MTVSHFFAIAILVPLFLSAFYRLMNRRSNFSPSSVLGRGVKFSLMLGLSLMLVRCAYNIGTRDRQIPGGYRLVSVPVFKNKTSEVSAEVYFTNALIRELQRSKLGKVVDKRDAEVQLLGTVESVKYVTTNSQVIGATAAPANVGSNDYARGAVQNTEYRVIVTTDLKLQRISDERILWEGKFSGEHNYLAPVISILGVNSADALYNQSARDQTVRLMSVDIMIEAYGRMTENF